MSEQSSLDRHSRRILATLQESGRLSNADLAETIGLSPSPCLARVRQLEREGVIRGYAALLDAERLGPSLTIFIQITLERQSEQRLEEFERAMLALPEVMECHLMTGDADYLLRVIVRDVVALRHFIVERLSKTAGVSNIRSSFSLKQVKYTTSLPIERLWPEEAAAAPARKAGRVLRPR